MSTKYLTRIAPGLLATAIALMSALPASAESTAELLEKGIYTEETVGDLTAAIEIYTKVVENAEANRRHVAQAQYRLAICYLKSGRDAEARLTLDQLIKEYPEQEQLVAQAREQLADARPTLDLSPAPWKDGESLEYRIALPTGKVIGAMWLKAESTVVDGIDAFSLELRRLVLTGANNRGVSRVIVDRDTLEPISSTIQHGILGNANATYGPDGVEITGGPTAIHVDSGQELYDNEQALHLMRMLPLEPGYTTKLSLLPTWTAKVIETSLEVTGKDVCQVPAGEFECFEIKLVDVDQTNWISTGPERYPLKVQAGGVVLELTDIGSTEPGAPVEYGMEDFGFSGSLPSGWLSYEFLVPGRASKAMVRVLDPDFDALSAIEIDRCPNGRCPGLLPTAERELAGCKERFDGYTLREGSWTERTVAGHPAISFIGDYLQDGEPWVQYRIYTLTDDKRFEFIFRTPLDRFEALRAGFDSAAETLEAE